MAKYEMRNKALAMRKRGMSYSQIKSKIHVSKSTLSLWLRNIPLSKEEIDSLRGKNEQRIERYRNKRKFQRETRLEKVFLKTSRSIGTLSKREIFLAGIFLYWAEGTKTSSGTVQITNTDPSMIQFFIQWFELEGFNRYSLHIRLHLYKDMNIEKETLYWQEVLSLPRSCFGRATVKDSHASKRRNYKGRFGHGTCSLTVYSVPLYEKILMSIRHVGSTNVQSGFPRNETV